MNDLISRSALLDRLTTERLAHYHTVHTNTASLVQHDQEFNVCMGIVFDFPSVDAEVVRHGRWIHPKDHVVANEFFCSECNKRTASLRPINRQPNGALLADENGNFYYPPTMKYCPNCGAKMDAEVHDDA